jgi:uncharacterized membrane protein
MVYPEWVVLVVVLIVVLFLITILFLQIEYYLEHPSHDDAPSGSHRTEARVARESRRGVGGVREA